MEKKFFIIAVDSKGDFGVVGKKAHDTLELARDHASELLKQPQNGASNSFYIVSTIGIVERVFPPVQFRDIAA